MAESNVLLIACGSFNPPTNMHLRMFEIARDHLQRMGNRKIVGGVMSPVHDAYHKKDLVSSVHRCNMLRVALCGNEWIQLSDWECRQSEWCRTVQVLQHHQNQLNSVLNANNDSPHKRQKRDASRDEVDDVGVDLGKWIPVEVESFSNEGPVKVMLLCGADLLESFAKPGLWEQEDIEAIVGQHGLVVITREGTNPYKFIYESDVLTKHMANIIIVTEWITNEVSSTKIRRAVRRGESIKYLIPDSVAQYIKENQLYRDTTAADKTTLNKYLQPQKKVGSVTFLTPSPSDIYMASPSPSGTIPIECPRIVNIQVKSQENTSKMAEFLGAEFGNATFGIRGHELLLNEENSKRSNIKTSKLISKSSSRDCLDGRKVSLASMPSPKNMKHFKSVDDSKLDTEKESKVEIKITDDGILVISDKETTV